jgi:hypothetical protein
LATSVATTNAKQPMDEAASAIAHAFGDAFTACAAKSYGRAASGR